MYIFSNGIRTLENAHIVKLFFDQFIEYYITLNENTVENDIVENTYSQTYFWEKPQNFPRFQENLNQSMTRASAEIRFSRQTNGFDFFSIRAAPAKHVKYQPGENSGIMKF